MKLVACSLLVACGAGELPPSVEPVVQPAPKPRPAKARQLDVNGDGFADVVASQATRLDPIQVPTAGSVLVYLGGKHGLRDVPDFELVGPNGDPLFGPIEVEGIGDVNGDGRSDLLVQETEINANAFGGSAVAYIYFGGRVGPSTTPDQQLMTPNGDRDHVRFATVGDVDGDGYSDLAARVDCPSLSWPEDKPDPRRCTRDLDALYIYRGSAKGLGATPATRSERKFDLRWSMLGLGDFDGDGFDDVLWHDEVFLGSHTGLATTPALTLTAPRGRLRIRRAARGGDLDHDGFPELVVIAPTMVIARASSRSSCFAAQPSRRRSRRACGCGRGSTTNPSAMSPGMASTT